MATTHRRHLFDGATASRTEIPLLHSRIKCRPLVQDLSRQTHTTPEVGNPLCKRLSRNLNLYLTNILQCPANRIQGRHQLTAALPIQLRQDRFAQEHHLSQPNLAIALRFEHQQGNHMVYQVGRGLMCHQPLRPSRVRKVGEEQQRLLAILSLASQ